LAPVGISTIADALRFHVDDVRLVGGDVRITARPDRTPSATAPRAGE
jgi:hypothetical protein